MTSEQSTPMDSSVQPCTRHTNYTPEERRRRETALRIKRFFMENSDLLFERLRSRHEAQSASFKKTILEAIARLEAIQDERLQKDASVFCESLKAISSENDDPLRIIRENAGAYETVKKAYAQFDAACRAAGKPTQNIGQEMFSTALRYDPAPLSELNTD